MNCWSPTAPAASTTAGSRTTRPPRPRPCPAAAGCGATLCDASDADYYTIDATAGQTLTINYPANAAGGVLRLLDANGAELGRVLPGSQGDFVLAAGQLHPGRRQQRPDRQRTWPTCSNGCWTRPAPARKPLHLLHQRPVRPTVPGCPQRRPHRRANLPRRRVSAPSGGPLPRTGCGAPCLSYNRLLETDGLIVRSNVNPFDGGDYTVVVADAQPQRGGRDPPVASPWTS